MIPTIHTSCLGQPPIPDSIRKLDHLELERRRNLPPLDPLPEDAKKALFDQYPLVAELDRQLQKEMASDDYDPSDHRVYSWAYEKLRPWAPSRVLQLLCLSIAAFGATKAFRYVSSHIPQPVIAAALVAIDSYATVAVFALLFAVLLPWLLFHKHRVGTDGMRRAVIMCAATSTLLAPIAAIASTSNVHIALCCGVFVRSLCIPISLWYWNDLRREAFLSPTRVARLLSVWRFLVTLLITVFGTALRLIAVFDLLPLSQIFYARARIIRMRLATRFPVALSLCGDPRGLFFLSSLIMAFSSFYLLYAFVFELDFFQKRLHRDSNSLFTRLMLSRGVYEPNIHPDEYAGRLSAPGDPKSLLPSPAMMLRYDDQLFNADSNLLFSDGIMPILDFLDKEKAIMEKEGITRWLPPRFDQIPLSEYLTEEKRSMDALISWARPLEDDDNDKSFIDYFETLEDDEYVYDPEGGNWIFEKAGTLREFDFERDSNSSQQPSADEGSEEVVKDGSSHDEDDLIEVPRDLEPWLSRMLGEEEGKQADDEGDAPSVSVYV